MNACINYHTLKWMHCVNSTHDKVYDKNKEQ